MTRITIICLDAGVSALLLCPVFYLLERYYFRNLRRSCCYFVLAVYLSAMFSVAGLPDICYIRFSVNMNLRPFAYMFSDYKSSILNILLFIPFGILLPCLFLRYRHWGSMICLGFGVSLAIEVLQIFTYRASDVNDLMTNTVGTLIGWFLSQLLWGYVPSSVSSEKATELYIVMGITFLVMFFLHPYAVRLVW